MSFIENLRKETSTTQTENGAKTYNTTLDAVVDLFAMGGALRSRNEDEVIKLFTKAFSQDATLALKCLFYLRDTRGGQGERKIFKTILKYMAETHTDQIMHLLYLIPEYGRYDDLYTLVGTPLEKNALDHLKNAAFGENGQEKDSLVFKWLKSENTSSKESKKLATITRKHFGLKPSKYRKLLSEGRALVKGLVERPLSAKKYSDIVYEQVPSKAGIKYRKAFARNDNARYTEFIQKALKGETKINTSVLYPTDIIKSYSINNGWNLTLKNLDNTLEAQWKQLPNYVQEGQNALVMADVSGSMTMAEGYPLYTSIGLAIYFAERNKGVFANHFMTFSGRPTLEKIQGSNLREKIMNVGKAHWEQNTNIQAAFDLILNTAIKNRIGQEEMPRTLYIISDMEFDVATVRHYSDKQTNFEAIKQKYTQSGYTMPQLVFWNVASRHNNLPVQYNEDGVALVSGYSPSTFKHAVEGKTPVEFMTEVLSQKRYEPIVAR